MLYIFKRTNGLFIPLFLKFIASISHKKNRVLATLLAPSKHNLTIYFLISPLNCRHFYLQIHKYSDVMEKPFEYFGKEKSKRTVSESLMGLLLRKESSPVKNLLMETKGKSTKPKLIGKRKRITVT